MSSADPIVTFLDWFEQARARLGEAAEIVALATAARDGAPSVRYVLYRGMIRGGLGFFTNYDSRKGRELEDNPRAAMAFHWGTFGRQIRIEGGVTRLTTAESDAYFASRPRQSQLGAHVSPQSSAIEDERDLVDEVRALDAELGTRPIERPRNWGGYRLEPELVELWTHADHRLHERWAFTRAGGDWHRQRLAP